MEKKNLSKYLVPVGALLAFVSMANATVVAPGGMAGAAVVSVGPGATQLASTTATLTDVATGLNATYTEWVYSDPTGVCAGCLDYVIIAADNAGSGDIIQSVTGFSFTGTGSTVTDVGYNTSLNGGPALSGAIAPVTVSRSSNGGVVSFDFRPGQINAGQSSDYLIIRTNATQYIPGTVTIQDGAAQTGPGYGVAPEPKLTYLLSVFALGIIGVAYRRRKTVVKNTEV